MGLFDKFKDLFTDEEEVYETIEIEVHEKDEEEHKLPTFMRNKIEMEEKEKEKEIKILEEQKKDNEAKEIAVLVENHPKKEENKFPFNFDDDDFVEPTRFSRSAVQKEKTIEKLKEPQTQTIKPYSNKKETEKTKKFRPTPVISPVYGVLDKNYKTEEVISKDEDSYTIQRPSKKVDFESVRKKAYGTLSDELKANMMCENCELLKEIKINKKIERLSKEDLLYNMTIEEEETEEEIVKEPEVREEKDITLGEASENYYDFGVSYDVPPQRSRKNEDVKIVNHAKEETVAEKVEVKEPEEFVKEEVKNESLDEKRSKDLELTDDLFNLIDSMYKERND